jgi:O-methyltransferase
MKTITTYEELINDIINSKITMIEKEIFKMPLRHFDKITNIEGDIVECGVWRGGYSIFLSHLFQDKNIWVCDSFEGFQPLDNARYNFKKERHTPQYSQCFWGPLGISLEEVKSNFKIYGLEDDPRIKYLKGFVKDTLPTSGIEKISLLRVDVDAYSATLEVLDELYHKVQPGGYIVFDDACLVESLEAIKFFLQRENLPLELINPFTDEIYSLSNPICDSDSGFLTGSYIIKK